VTRQHSYAVAQSFTQANRTLIANQRINRTTMRAAIIAICMLLGTATPAAAEISIGINIGFYPDLVMVPGYPVYYAPQLNTNLFFYDGLYWVYAQDRWYASSWYNGPWDMMEPEMVPYFVLRVPVLYYRQPPQYFIGWRREEPPRWGEHWGRDWEERRRGWDHWDRASAPPPAPLPTYQRQYTGDRYPRPEQQQALRTQHYQYQPHEPVVRQVFEHSHAAAAPAQPSAQNPRGSRGAPPADTRRANPPADRPASADRPPTAERAATAGRAESRPPSGTQPPDSRRQQADRPATQQTQADRPRPQSNSSPDSQRRTGSETRASAPPPAAAREGNPVAERQQARPAQAASPPREAQQASRPAPQAERPPQQAERPAQQAERPPAKSQAQEPKREPEREREHQ
jgi:hypothetical protein